MTQATTRAAGQTHDTAFINGEWRAVGGDRPLIDVVNPWTTEVIASVVACSAAEVDEAVAAARAAFPAWSATPPSERAKLLGAVREGLAARQQEIAATISAEMGSPLSFASAVQVGTPIRVLDTFVSVLDGYVWSERVNNSLVEREAAGVVGAITPWNYPLHQVVAKLGAALAAGCTVVLKPSEVAPLSAIALMDVLAEAGLPPGVVNLVPGTGPEVGEAIASHPGIDVVSFTGSTRAGTRVAELASATVKRVALELGGKSANVILDDADLAKAVKVGVAQCFVNAGQTCSALTRMLVPAERYDEAVELAVAAAEKYAVGDPSDEATRLGPLASQAQQQRVLGFLEGARAEGARVVTGGEAVGPGYAVAATVLADVTPEMTVAREEVFGPVLSVLRYTDEADAVRIANDTDYGLAGAVWSADEERALAVARQLRTGQVDVNGGRFNAAAPFGGYKRSGIGRELGQLGIDEFVEVKSIQL